MKYSQLRRGLSFEETAAYVGSKELLRQFELAKWLKPFIRGNRLTRFDIRDLDGCITGAAINSRPREYFGNLKHECHRPEADERNKANVEYSES
jgi:hypothetical protein